MQQGFLRCFTVTTLAVTCLVATLAPPQARAVGRDGGLRWFAVRQDARVATSPRLRLIKRSSVMLSDDESRLLVASSARSSLAVLDAFTLGELERVSTIDSVDSLLLTRDGRFVVAWGTFGRLARNLWASLARGGSGMVPSNEVFVLDHRNFQLLHRIDVGQNVGAPAELSDGTLLVPAVQGRRLSRLDLAVGESLAALDTRRHAERFIPTTAAIRSDDLLAAVTAGAFVAGSGREVGDRVLFCDPREPANRARLTVFRGLEHPRGIVFLPDGRHLVIADRRANAMVLLDWVDQRLVARLPVAPRPDQIGWLRDGRTLWVLHATTPVLTLLDPMTGAVAVRRLGGVPSGPPALSPNGQWLYVPTGGADGVSVLHLPEARLVDHIPTPEWVAGLALSRDGARLFAALRDGGRVVRIE